MTGKKDAKNGGRVSERLDNLSPEKLALLKKVMKDQQEAETSAGDAGEPPPEEPEKPNEEPEKPNEEPSGGGGPWNPFAQFFGGANSASWQDAAASNPWNGAWTAPGAGGPSWQDAAASNPWSGALGGWPPFADNFWSGGSGGAGGSAPPNSPLVALKPQGDLPPFFLVHAVFGSSFPYHRLAMHMDPRQPVYGIQSIGLDGREEPLDNIEDMAARYIELIRSVQARGPYFLGGYSFGGWAAFEMARILTAAGERVDALAILGTTVPFAALNPILVEEWDKWSGLARDYAQLMFNTAVAEELRGGFDWTKNLGLSPQQRVAWINYLSHFRYSPRPLAGRLDLFVTEDLKHMIHHDASMGWRMLATEGVDTHLCAGNHISTFQEPHVQDLANKLTACLERARQRRENGASHD